MADVMITNVSDPALWARLKEMWEAGNRPGWVVLANENYEVFLPEPQPGEESIRFLKRATRMLYTTSSF